MSQWWRVSDWQWAGQWAELQTVAVVAFAVQLVAIVGTALDLVATVSSTAGPVMEGTKVR